MFEKYASRDVLELGCPVWDEMLEEMLETHLFADTPDGHLCHGQGFTYGDVAGSEGMQKDLRTFVRDCTDLNLLEADWKKVARLFAYSRSGHGVGFFDSEWPELQSAATRFGPVHIERLVVYYG